MNEETREGIGANLLPMSAFVESVEFRMETLTGKYDAMLDALAIPESERLTQAQLTKPFLVIGPPGIGKTVILSGIAEKLTADALNEGRSITIGFKAIRLGVHEIGDLTGIPMYDHKREKLVKFQPEDFPDAERDGEYGILLLDEITTVDLFQMLPALGLTDDTRTVTNYTLPPKWLVVAAGNGPECRNFVKLDDVLLTRFNCFDIQYDYQKDFRNFAEEQCVHPLVIAYLNFKPEDIVAVKSSEYDKAGKLFPCPRTWFDFSLLIKEIELKAKIKSRGPISATDMENLAAGKIGKETALKFAAFYQFSKTMIFDVEKIFLGKEKMPSTVLKLQEEQFHIIMEQITKKFKDLLVEDSVNATYSEALLTQSAHAMLWILDLGKLMLDRVLQALVKITRGTTGTQDLFSSPEFETYCPQMNKFFEDNAEAFANVDLLKYGG